MSTEWWDRPVRVMLRRNLADNVGSLARAAEVLLNEWPAERGPRHLRAQQAILRAMEKPDDPGPSIAARMAFEAAAREVDILVERGTTDKHRGARV